PFVELHMIGSHLQHSHPLCLHVPSEVNEIPAVGFKRMLREKHIAHPGNERFACYAVSYRGKRFTEKSRNPLRRRFFTIEEVGLLGNKRCASRRSDGTESWENGREVFF